jgi:hypothetical protein
MRDRIYSAEPLITDSTLFGVETGITRVKMYISPPRVQILAEMIQAGSVTLISAINTLNNSI